jgi:hypothetical protein
MKKLFLAGEGPNELGRWSKEPEYRDLYNDVGVIEAVLKKVTTSGWKVVDACRWKNIRTQRFKYTALSSSKLSGVGAGQLG